MDYKKTWETANSMMKIGNNRSALDEVMKIYDYALKHKDYEQVVKAIIYRIDNQESVEEEILDSLKQDVERLPQPAKSVVYNIIGNVYKEYYTKNYHVADRTRADLVLALIAVISTNAALPPPPFVLYTAQGSANRWQQTDYRPRQGVCTGRRRIIRIENI
ncbi:MAG: hypothetical protein LBT50_02640 [Prevotellaceae bacterium]|nr:hypothetical protein [Prevotellaceae bacterium]